VVVGDDRVGDDADADPGDHRTHRKVPTLDMMAVVVPPRRVTVVVPPRGRAMDVPAMAPMEAMGAPMGPTPLNLPVGAMTLHLTFDVMAASIIPALASIASHGVRGGEQAQRQSQGSGNAGNRARDVQFACHG
jgi:hypothetical protein